MSIVEQPLITHDTIVPVEVDQAYLGKIRLPDPPAATPPEIVEAIASLSTRVDGLIDQGLDIDATRDMGTVDFADPAVQLDELFARRNDLDRKRLVLLRGIVAAWGQRREVAEQAATSVERQASDAVDEHEAIQVEVRQTLTSAGNGLESLPQYRGGNHAAAKVVFAIKVRENTRVGEARHKQVDLENALAGAKERIPESETHEAAARAYVQEFVKSIVG